MLWLGIKTTSTLVETGGHNSNVASVMELFHKTNFKLPGQQRLCARQYLPTFPSSTAGAVRTSLQAHKCPLSVSGQVANSDPSQGDHTTHQYRSQASRLGLGNAASISRILLVTRPQLRTLAQPCWRRLSVPMSLLVFLISLMTAVVTAHQGVPTLPRGALPTV